MTQVVWLSWEVFDRLIAEAKRREIGNTRLVLQNGALLAGVVLDITSHFGTGTDQAHFSAEHVPKLREFVEFSAAKQPAERSNAGIVISGDGWSENIRVKNHGSEFPDQEWNSKLADPLLAVKDRTSVSEFDRKGDEEEKRTEQNQPEGREEQVVTAFGSSMNCVGIPPGRDGRVLAAWGRELEAVFKSLDSG